MDNQYESKKKSDPEKDHPGPDNQSSEASFSSFEDSAISPESERLHSRQRQQALLSLQETHGNTYVLQRLSAKGKNSRSKPSFPKFTASDIKIQRYAAGEAGHGEIEQTALPKVGFSEQETSQVYFGNWLRDFSQLNSSGSPLAQPDLLSLYSVVRILGWGEYNREVSPQELGAYVPSEHLDNPSAGGLAPGVAETDVTIEDPEIQVLATKYPKGDPRRRPFDDAFDRLSPQQQAAYQSEEARRSEITAASKASGLPEYIERGKMHSKDKLKTAIGWGRQPRGFQDMGDALHVVEDYFSHSNFVDVALWTLHNEGVAAAEPYVQRMVERMHGTNPALVGGVGPSGQPNIVTGSYSVGANQTVSQLELLKTQLHSGEFAKAFIIGLIRMGTVSAEQIASALGGQVGSALGSGIGYLAGGAEGAVLGLGQGASSGASQGYEEGAEQGYNEGNDLGGGGLAGEALGEVGSLVEGAVGGVEGLLGGAYRGLVGGASRGSAAGSARGSAIGKAVGAATGGGLMGDLGSLALTQAQIDMLLLAPGIRGSMAPYLLIIDQILDHYTETYTTQSGVQAASRFLTGPTHSQIAKDSPDHPLYGVSVLLAQEADRQIGIAIQAAWAARTGGGSGAAPGAGGTGPAAAASPLVSDVEAQPVTSLVDQYISYPTGNNWWRAILVPALH